MKHQVMIAVEVDTTAIEQRLEANADNEVLDALLAEARKDTDRPSSFRAVECAAREFVERNRDDIIQAIVSEAMRRVPKMKAFREAMFGGAE